MALTKYVWVSGELISAAKLNLNSADIATLENELSYRLIQTVTAAYLVDNGGPGFVDVTLGMPLTNTGKVHFSGSAGYSTEHSGGIPGSPSPPLAQWSVIDSTTVRARYSSGPVAANPPSSIVFRWSADVVEGY